MMTELRARKMAAFFHAADANKDGVLEQADYEQLLQNVATMRGLQAGTAEYDRLSDAYMMMWKPLQTFKLTLPDYLQILGSIENTAETRNLNLAVNNSVFDMMDADGDNNVSLQNYTEYLAAHNIGANLAESAFKHMDTDGDGLITREQYAQLSTDFFFSDDEAAPGNWLWGEF